MGQRVVSRAGNLRVELARNDGRVSKAEVQLRISSVGCKFCAETMVEVKNCWNISFSVSVLVLVQVAWHVFACYV